MIHSRVGRLVAAAAALVLVLSGCSSSGKARSGGGPVKIDGTTPATGLRGTKLPRPVTLSESALSATFQSSAGGTTTLRDLQRGHLMLVYFGYTHCPDVCPTTMADLAQALQELPAPVSARTQVVTITSDPVRDTAPVLARWLSNFDAGLPLHFVGLSASLKQIDTIAASVGVPLEPPVTNPDGSVSVQHGAQTLAFVDGKASVLWLAGTTPADYGNDIAQLVPGS